MLSVKPCEDCLSSSWSIVCCGAIPFKLGNTHSQTTGVWMKISASPFEPCCQISLLFWPWCEHALTDKLSNWMKSSNLCFFHLRSQHQNKTPNTRWFVYNKICYRVTGCFPIRMGDKHFQSSGSSSGCVLRQVTWISSSAFWTCSAEPGPRTIWHHCVGVSI